MITMPLNTIFITNRDLKTNSSYGEKLSKVNRIAIATPVTKRVEKWRRVYRGKKRIKKSYFEVEETYELTPIGEQYSQLSMNQEAINLCTQLANEGGNNRPWLLFLHGNNQTLEKNLHKARKIQELYRVNLIIYSWPSKAFDDNVEKYLIAAGIIALVPGGWSVTKHLATHGIKRKIKQYKAARKNAKLTAASFVKALNFINEYLLKPLQQKGIVCNMLAHSLGHKVLKDAIIREPTCFDDTNFNNCVLHQADESYVDHPWWCEKMPVSSPNKVTITNNYNDAVLFLAGLLNNGGNIKKPFTRLGNRKNFNHNSSQLSYMELTGNQVGWQHGIAWHTAISDEVKSQFEALFTQ